ncbi:MAG TPA: hypothetical protein ENJ19_11660 [Gammaproteobacteria bacterium]|nr:hypothetical protein [Gammaproteobacteria bacterium]
MTQNTKPEPAVGDWFITRRGEVLEVIAINDEAGTIEVQYYDGQVREYDLESWHMLSFMPVSPLDGGFLPPQDKHGHTRRAIPCSAGAKA